MLVTEICHNKSSSPKLEEIRPPTFTIRGRKQVVESNENCDSESSTKPEEDVVVGEDNNLDNGLNFEWYRDQNRRRHQYLTIFLWIRPLTCTHYITNDSCDCEYSLKLTTNTINYDRNTCSQKNTIYTVVGVCHIRIGGIMSPSS
jgi:hypothetical protein